MGLPVEQPIKTLFNGVSRQPPSIRLPSQVEEADNVYFSVTTGGFEKRAATHHITSTGLDPVEDYKMHIIDRDAVERYAVVFGDNTIRVFHADTGAAQTVTALDADAIAYLTSDPWDFVCATVVDYTFVANITRVIEMETTTATGTMKGYKQKFSDLPSSGNTTGDVWGILGATESDTKTYFVKYDGANWIECPAVGTATTLKATTMPYQLVRNPNTTWTFAKATWDVRPAGDAVTLPPPAFVGRTINDLTYFRNRLAAVTDESVVTTQTDDVYNWWPKRASVVLATDPVDLDAPGGSVSILQYAVPFRKTLFATAQKHQFEVSGTKFSPDDSGIDKTTSYEADTLCAPITLGDQLYFASRAERGAMVYEYYYDADTLSNTAADTTKHCLGYIPAGLRQLAAVASSDRLFVLPDSTRDSLYVYTTYWSGVEKVQSAWGRLTFDGHVYSIGSLDTSAILLIRRGNEVCLERLPGDREGALTGLGFAPLIDRRVSLVGVYNAGGDETTWTLPYKHDDDVMVILGGSYTDQVGLQLNVTYPTDTTVKAAGDFSSGLAVIGVPYRALVELSAQYVRDGQGSTVLTGRTQMQRVYFDFSETGGFEVHVTPRARVSKIRKMVGRVLGDISNVLGVPAIMARGTFKVPVNSRADTVRIQIINDSPLPHVVTSAVWTGLHTNILKEK